MAELTPVGAWRPGDEPVLLSARELAFAVQRVREPMRVVLDADSGQPGVAFGGRLEPSSVAGALPLLGVLPALYPEWLGDRTFSETHGLRFPYAAGSMANGIATPRLVTELARAGCLAFFGAAGLEPARVEAALDELERELGRDAPGWGSNLIHSPNEPELETAVADLYLRRGVRTVEASAFMGLTPAVVRYALSGLTLGGDGQVRRRNRLIAKVSRPEVARRFLEPPPPELVQALVTSGRLTEDEARLGASLPLVEDVTVEADSAGHTDNQPLPALLPVILSLRDRVAAERGYTRPIRVGSAGGLGSPGAVAAAFALGAAYVVTGTVNQACVESGLSEAGRAMLAGVGLGDVMMAPAADMFELGVEVQVLKRGSMFGPRAAKLYELYRAHPSLDALPDADRERLERDFFRTPLDRAWRDVEAYWRRRDPSQLERAVRDPKHRLALLFRAYLGQSSRWAMDGTADRRADFQIWCGPAMAAFNAWTAGSFLEEAGNRTVTQVARNLLEGAAVLTRAHQLRTFGVPVPPSAAVFRPRPLA
jgi:PfaD family protein